MSHEGGRIVFAASVCAAPYDCISAWRGCRGGGSLRAESAASEPVATSERAHARTQTLTCVIISGERTVPITGLAVAARSRCILACQRTTLEGQTAALLFFPRSGVKVHCVQRGCCALDFVPSPVPVVLPCVRVPTRPSRLVSPCGRRLFGPRAENFHWLPKDFSELTRESL